MLEKKIIKSKSIRSKTLVIWRNETTSRKWQIFENNFSFSHYIFIIFNRRISKCRAGRKSETSWLIMSHLGIPYYFLHRGTKGQNYRFRKGNLGVGWGWKYHYIDRKVQIQLGTRYKRLLGRINFTILKMFNKMEL